MKLPPITSIAKNKFWHQKWNAKRRGVAWKMTMQEWWGVWQTSGKWELRGRAAGAYVMARKKDVGPYSVRNVYITTASANRTDFFQLCERSPSKRTHCPHGHEYTPENTSHRAGKQCKKCLVLRTDAYRRRKAAK